MHRELKNLFCFSFQTIACISVSPIDSDPPSSNCCLDEKYQNMRNLLNQTLWVCLQNVRIKYLFVTSSNLGERVIQRSTVYLVIIWLCWRPIFFILRNTIILRKLIPLNISWDIKSQVLLKVIVMTVWRKKIRFRGVQKMHFIIIFKIIIRCEILEKQLIRRWRTAVLANNLMILDSLIDLCP